MLSIGRSVTHELGVRSAIGRFDSPAWYSNKSNRYQYTVPKVYVITLIIGLGNSMLTEVARPDPAIDEINFEFPLIRSLHASKYIPCENASDIDHTSVNVEYILEMIVNNSCQGPYRWLSARLLYLHC